MRLALLTDCAGIDLHDPGLDREQVLRSIGRNTGNLAFQLAVEKHFVAETEHVSWNDDPGRIAEEFDVVVVPEASVIVETKDFGWKADFIEKVDLPVITVGVGFQDPRPRRDPSVPLGTLRYLRVLSERAHAIGVRGDRTLRILEANGIHNAVVCGCPSLFWNSSADLGASIERRLEQHKGPLRPAVTAGPSKRALRGAHRRLLKWVENQHGTWIAQSGDGLAAALDGNTYSVAEGEFSRRLRLARTRNLVSPIAFLDPRVWMRQLQEHDVVVSPRIHGSILATQASTAAFCIAHDGRTSELASTCGIPTFTASKVARSRNLDDLIRSHGFDGAHFDRCRSSVATTYVDLIERSGATPVGWLIDLARGPSLG